MWIAPCQTKKDQRNLDRLNPDWKARLPHENVCGVIPSGCGKQGYVVGLELCSLWLFAPFCALTHGCASWDRGLSTGIHEKHQHLQCETNGARKWGWSRALERKFGFGDVSRVLQYYSAIIVAIAVLSIMPDNFWESSKFMQSVTVS